MLQNKKSIPVNAMADNGNAGVAVERISFFHQYPADKETLAMFEEGNVWHRHDSHSFFLLEKGTIDVEIDFQKFQVKSPSLMYVHPDQVHRTLAFETFTVSSLSINNETLNSAYLALLEEMVPAKPLLLNTETFSILSKAISLCLAFAELKTEILYHALLKDSCNAFVALVISKHLELVKPADRLSRFDTITKAFRQLLESNYKELKRPAEYARKLNISTAYLNECVKNTTGHSVTHHIQQRTILEGKRLLYHSDKSVKEIATELGYDDYAYFSRLFIKLAGIGASAFRTKNRV